MILLYKKSPLIFIKILLCNRDYHLLLIHHYGFKNKKQTTRIMDVTLGSAITSSVYKFCIFHCTTLLSYYDQLEKRAQALVFVGPVTLSLKRPVPMH